VASTHRRRERGVPPYDYHAFAAALHAPLTEVDANWDGALRKDEPEPVESLPSVKPWSEFWT
jgi:hypothetical protein